MAKKKRTQLKPVARGFATTSMPKKAETVENALSTSDCLQVSECPECPPSSAEGTTQYEPDVQVVEQPQAQNLLDKYQDKIEKDISRSIKTIETDRRYSRTFLSVSVDPALIDHIFQLHQEEETQEVRKYLDEPIEKITASAALTYGVLRRLGFAEDKVEQCLHAIQGVDLDEAYEWLYVYCSDAELENALPQAKTEDPSRTPQDVQAPSVAIPDVRCCQASAKSDASAAASFPFPNVMPSNNQSASSTPTNASTDFDASALACSSSEPEDPNVAYARIKMQIVDIRRNGQNMGMVAHLEDKLREAKAHYFFDERDAQSLYQTELKKADSQLLQDKLRGVLPPRGPEPSTRSVTRGIPTRVFEPTCESDFFDEDKESSGGLLELLEAIPAEIQDTEGNTIRIKDMSFSKNGSTRLPELALMEYISKADRFATVEFNIISGLSRAKRARVRVIWRGKGMDEWRMEGDACHDESQAQQYIATVALHALMFPKTEGFAIGSQSATRVGTTPYRLFPPAFRDLWDDLEAIRKDKNDCINRNIWTKLQNIVVKKVSGVLPSRSGPKVGIDNRSARPELPVQKKFDVDSDKLIADFKARQMRPVYQEMLAHRQSLPIAKFREQILGTLERSQILVLCGETGCGKSTQVPAFILEDHLGRGMQCKIYCTEPRRISAISLAQRVSQELGDPPGIVGTPSSLVGYAIRLENHTTRDTRLAYVTTGVALRMLEGGPGGMARSSVFDEITHIIIDEVHERSIESDFLLMVLKSLAQSKPELRIILMSATLDADKFSNYFGGCPILHVPGRTFPVDAFFMEDAVERTGWSISEDSPYAKRWYRNSHKNGARTDWEETATLVAGDEDDDEKTVVNEQGAVTSTGLETSYSARTVATMKLFDERFIPYELIVRLLEHLCFEDGAIRAYSRAVLIFMPGLAEIRRLSVLLSEHASFRNEELFRIYPLHSTISTDDQRAAFDVLPRKVRKIVIATNIAETGITIPDITCVIDSGKHREMMFDEKRQMSRLVDSFVARSNAAQRRGRAGRLQRGLCFHLFTKSRHDTLLAERPLPEIMRLSLSDIALRIKTLKVNLGDSIESVLCGALDPPTLANIRGAISALVEVKALTLMEDVTPMGRLLSALPSDVYLGKFLLMAVVFRCLDPALTIAAALNSRSLFVKPLGFEYEADRAKDSFQLYHSDFLTIHNAFSSWRRACANPGIARKYCRQNFLSNENLLQIEELRQQLFGYLVDSSFVDVDPGVMRELNRARFGRNNSYKPRFLTIPTDLNVNSNSRSIVNAAVVAGLFPKLLSTDAATGQMRTISNNQTVSFHPSSVNFRKQPRELSANHFVYYTLIHKKRLYAQETAPVDDLAILLACGECEFKLMSDSAIVDRKIRYRLTPKANVAIKILRRQFHSILSRRFHGKPLTVFQSRWYELVIAALSGIEQERRNDGEGSIKVIH
ncbi:P-loop containing nucleoside triphosphate hydrolase protein [Pisolithus marmoratus]|nr:P-loop containing nucleoside triphosphate hydrolase protein [Pisolithus marmoratus]